MEIKRLQPTFFICVELAGLTAPIGDGNQATIIEQTSPDTSYKISVIYKSGPSTAQGLGPTDADSNGMVTWTWLVGGPNLLASFFE